MPRVRRAALLASMLAALIVPATASAADSVYWGDFDSAAIRVGNLDGSGSPSSLFTGESAPGGVAIDSAAGKIYWANAVPDGAIRVGNLDGSGSPSSLFTDESAPVGVAIDPAAGKIYWANEGPGTIRVGNLDGSGSPSSLFTGENAPTGVAIDPAAGKIYWAGGPDAIRVGNLDGSGSASNLFTGESFPEAVAIDPEASKIYWTTAVTDGAIRTGNLDGTGSASNLFAGESQPAGVALDPVGGKIYWANAIPGPDGAIRTGNLDGSGSASNLFAGESLPVFTALLRAPAGTGAPQISGGGQVGDQLSCSEGSWAPDLLGAFLFRAPSGFAYQWQLGGTDIGGADQPTYTPTEPGSYTCQVTASNHAGPTAQTSEPHQVDPLPPSCEPVSATTGEDQPVDVTLDCSGQGTLTYEIVSDPSDGEISDFDPSAGTLTYTPDSGFFGEDSFTYRASNAGGNSNTATATITVNPPPPTCEPLPVTTGEDQPVDVTLDCSGQGTLTFDVISQPADGEISDFDPSAGTLTYTPDSGFTGADSFAYRASNAGGNSDPATATITVIAAPTCEPVSATTGEGQPVDVTLECSGQGTLDYEIVTQPADGEISDLDPSAGTLTYTPDNGFFGEDSFTYQASNAGGSSSPATATITVEPPPPACENVPVSIPHETQAEISLECSGQGTLTYELVTQPADGEISDLDPSAGTLVYAPDSGFTGRDSFTYRAENAGGPSNTATVRITVDPPPPTCEDTSTSTPFEQPTEITLDCSGPGTFNFEIVSDPADGEISDLDPSAGTLTYTPDEGFIGEDSFTYRASNASGNSSPATATIAVEAPPPTCEDTSSSTPFEQPVGVTLECSGRGTLTYEVLSNPIHGQVSGFDPSAGTFTYNPDSGFNGTDSLAYRARSSGGPSGTRIATITVEPPPPIPSNRFNFGNLSHNKKRGTARLRVRVSGPGKLRLARTGKVRPKTKRTDSAAAVKLKVKPRRQARKRLRRRGTVMARAAVTFTPEGGEPRTKSRRVELTMKRRRR